MEVLEAFVHRLKQLRLHPNPSEAKALAEWVKSGGLRSLEPTLLSDLENIEETSNEPRTLNVRRFDEWQVSKFEVLPYNTVAEFKEVVAKAFNINPEGFKLQFRYTENPVWGPHLLEPSVSLDDLPREGHLEVVIVPNWAKLSEMGVPAWFVREGKMTMPVNVHYDEKEEKVLVPLYINSLVGDIVKFIRDKFPNMPPLQIIFLNPRTDTASHGDPEAKALAEWAGHEFGDVDAYRIEAESN